MYARRTTHHALSLDFFAIHHLSFTALMYKTLFPRTKASPYLFFNWPSTYSWMPRREER